MNGTAARFLRLGVSLSGLVVLGWVLTGQAAKPAPEGLPTDWTNRHLIFSQPSTSEQVRRLTRDPRYWQQWVRRNVVRIVSEDGSSPADETSMQFGGPLGTRFRTVHRDWSENLGSGATSGAGNFPAKFAFQVTSANCGNAPKPDYVVFTTGLLGSQSQASIAAYDNLYFGCTGIVPTVYWAYNTGGQILTSPVTSGDGTQVAFVQTNPGFLGTLVLLKFAAMNGTVGAPVTLTAVPNGNYRSCSAPCMTAIILRDHLGTATDDRTSSVFPDYTHDIIWVGGASNWLHKITGVFRGTPAEATTGGFPDQLNPGNPTSLSSPVYDFASGNVFVGDLGGFLYRVVATTGAVTASGQLDHGTGVVSGPIVDSIAGKVYVFASSDGTTNCVGASPCSAVYLFGTNFAAGTASPKAIVGASSATPNVLYEGDFDNIYQNSSNATGNLYVCGNTGGPPIIYQVPINAGVMGTVVPGPVLANATTGCSPVTDVPNPNATGGASEWIFASVQDSGQGNSCASGGCIMNFKNRAWTAGTAYAAGQEVLDSHLQIQVVRVAGTSGSPNPPPWSVTLDGSTTDNTVKWINQGPLVPAHSAWQANHGYALNDEILDTNNNVQIVISAGTSKTGAHPPWNMTINGQTVDNSVRWHNIGALATNSLAATGGTSGINLDNTVGSGTLLGASQIYYSTLSNQPCGSNGTGGCAVQASQSALK